MESECKMRQKLKIKWLNECCWWLMKHHSDSYRSYAHDCNWPWCRWSMWNMVPIDLRCTRRRMYREWFDWNLCRWTWMWLDTWDREFADAISSSFSTIRVPSVWRWCYCVRSSAMRPWMHRYSRRQPCRWECRHLELLSACQREQHHVHHHRPAPNCEDKMEL